MSTTGMNLHPDTVAIRRRRAQWLTRRGWTAREIFCELGVCMRTVARYRMAEAPR